ncbi:LuxR C-terminal-related transcriptional regulator [Nocardioides sp. YIM 152588]|uniref:LuxR C-terminal-related transcriptional regulator n=1 Tax=Nocardioides sp. YIM 152588 TaxID=3158259 RepID=UPI0032E4A990
MSARIDAPADSGFSWEAGSEDVAVLELVATGRTIGSIARQLDVSDRTVRRRLRAAADDLGVGSTIEVVVHAVRRGLI